MIKILQRNYEEFDYRINDGYNPPNFKECQIYLARQSRILKKLGTKIENYIGTKLWTYASNNELGYYDLIEKFDGLMKYYEDIDFLKSITWRTMPKLTIETDSKYYKIYSRHELLPSK